MNKIITNPRELAVKTLVRTQNGAYSNLQVDSDLRHADLSSVDRRFYTSLVYGVLQHQLTFAYQIKPFLKRPDKTDDWVLVLLYTAMYQMQYMDRVPKRAIFDETIKVAKELGHDGIRRMVTGILHAMDRKGLPDPVEIKNPIERISVVSSVPEWLVDMLSQQLDVEKVASIFSTINQAPKQSIRVNTKVTDVATLKAELEDDGYDVHSSQVASEALIVESGSETLTNTLAFVDGKFTIQDESAMLPVESMTINPGDQILDACAAPGGKTTQIATRLSADQGGQITALDIHENKLKQIQANAKRLQVADVIKTEALDARKVDERFDDESFDQILVDAPCSGLGLIRRKPEIRYQKQPSDIDKLSQVQFEILNAMANKVKIGGQITYSTCTIVNQENIEVVQKFLQNHPNFQLQMTKTDLNLKPNRNEPDLRIYPDDYLSDGFYVSSLIRTK